MYGLPTTVTIGDAIYTIRERGDYRMVLDCFAALNDVELSEIERTISSLVIFYNELDSIDDVVELSVDVAQSLIAEMFNFFNCGESSNVVAETNFKAIDWEGDSQLICSAINNVAHTEIRSVEYCHWWTFIGFFSSVGESPLSTVVGIRNKIAKGKKLEKYELEFKRENPQYFVWDSRTLKQKEEDELLSQIWNSGG